MTLILNEVHLLNGLSETMLVAAADRRVSKLDGSYDSTRKKLFRIPHLNGAISYFGLAAFPQGGTLQYLSSWLPNFIRTQSSAPDLETFVDNLRNALERTIPAAVLQGRVSGFHICGYNKSDLPEFWSFSNIGSIQDFQYVDLSPQYSPPSPDFLERDAKGNFGWDGSDPLSARNGVQFYRNGDFRAHVAAWESLDEVFSILFQFPDFKRPSSPSEYGEYVRFKFEFIAYLYKKWAKKVIIGRPIDVIVILPTTMT
jgi:hypothetical protein